MDSTSKDSDNVDSNSEKDKLSDEEKRKFNKIIENHYLIIKNISIVSTSLESIFKSISEIGKIQKDLGFLNPHLRVSSSLFLLSGMRTSVLKLEKLLNRSVFSIKEHVESNSKFD